MDSMEVVHIYIENDMICWLWSKPSSVDKSFRYIGMLCTFSYIILQYLLYLAVRILSCLSHRPPLSSNINFKLITANRLPRPSLRVVPLLSLEVGVQVTPLYLLIVYSTPPPTLLQYSFPLSNILPKWVNSGLTLNAGITDSPPRNRVSVGIKMSRRIVAGLLFASAMVVLMAMYSSVNIPTLVPRPTMENARAQLPLQGPRNSTLGFQKIYYINMPK